MLKFQRSESVDKILLVRKCGLYSISRTSVFGHDAFKYRVGGVSGTKQRDLKHRINITEWH